MTEEDEPLFTTTFGVGKYGIVSIGVITGYNIFTNMPEEAGAVLTIGGGVVVPPLTTSWQWPQ